MFLKEKRPRIKEFLTMTSGFPKRQRLNVANPDFLMCHKPGISDSAFTRVPITCPQVTSDRLLWTFGDSCKYFRHGDKAAQTASCGPMEVREFICVADGERERWGLEICCAFCIAGTSKTQQICQVQKMGVIAVTNSLAFSAIDTSGLSGELGDFGARSWHPPRPPEAV